MKRIRFIYGAMLLVLALAMNACDDYYSVAVAGDPGVTPVVLTTPEESITLPAKDAAGEVEIVTNMENSTISIAVPADAKSWCSAALSGNKIAVTLVDNPRTIARSTILTVKVFSITCKIEVVQEAKTPEPIYPIEGTYKFNIPSVSDFDATKIYKVMDGNLKVAEICLEYLKNDNIASRAVVVYTGEGGAADYTRGFVAYLVDDEGNVYLAGVNADEHMMVFWEGSAQCEIVLPKPLPADLFSGLLLPCEQKGTAAPDSSAPEIKPVIQDQTRQVTPTEAPTSISATQ